MVAPDSLARRFASISAREAIDLEVAAAFRAASPNAVELPPEDDAPPLALL